jgi:hypothetical protein
MAVSPAHSSRPSEPATLGRLGGLAPGESDRGAKSLWLAGGGYRAALFHLGALTRFNELGILAQTGTVGAVAGGSIIAALLATRVPWPLHGGYREWPERVAEPMRAIARRNARARAFLRRPFPVGAGGAALEERYARELVRSLGGESEQGPHFVFGASGLILSGLAAGWEDCLEWDIGAATAGGYGSGLVERTIAAVRTDLDAFGEAEQAVLENHGYLLADAALRDRGLATAGGIELRAPTPPHPRWMNEDRVREALAASARQTPLGRLRPRRAERGKRAPQSTSAELTALLGRHRPLLHYDSLESCRADSVATICELVAPGRCNTLHRADGSLIAAAAPSGGVPRLEPGFLGGPTYADGQPARHDDYLDECGASYAADALAMRRDEGRADVVYGHARHDREGRLWLQYWFFHYYADRGLLGLEQHEGDWELMQVRLDGGLEPEAATFARHGGGERLNWDEVELADSGEGPALVVYPARGSHAPLPRAGSFEAAVVRDHNDGLGRRLRPALIAIDDDGPGWVRWPGRWGSTRRREFFEADSPRGPREQPHWWDPAGLHSEARPWQEGRVGGGQPPPRPDLVARREGELAVVSYGFAEPATSEAEPARFVAAPLAGDDAEPCVAQSLAIDARQGSFAVRLPGERPSTGVRVSVASVHGVFGATLLAPFE